METKVVNVKVKHIRPKYNNLEEWMNDENNVYIGRAQIVFINKKRFPPKASIFANPFKLKKEGDDAYEKYKIYIKDRLSKEPELRKELLNLKGKNLGCWCKPERCHGDTLIECINELSENK